MNTFSSPALVYGLRAPDVNARNEARVIEGKVGGFWLHICIVNDNIFAWNVAQRFANCPCSPDR